MSSVDLKNGVATDPSIDYTQPTVVAPVIKNTDELVEGKNNFFYTELRAKALFQGLLRPVLNILGMKQDKIQSADDIPSGKKNQYFSEEAVRAMFAPKLQMLMDLIEKKQDKMSSTDELPEGRLNKYYAAESALGPVYVALAKSQESFNASLAKVLAQSKADKEASSLESIGHFDKLTFRVVKLESVPRENLKAEIAALKAEIEALKSIQVSVPAVPQGEIIGDSRTIKVVVGQSDKGLIFQEIEIRGGKIARIFPQKGT